MISPHTPPGMYVVANQNARGGLTEGHTYVLEKVVLGTDHDGVMACGAQIVGLKPEAISYLFGLFPVHFPAAYALWLFDYAVLPKALRELTTKAPDPALLKETENA